jgi:hypothetical protein
MQLARHVKSREAHRRYRFTSNGSTAPFAHSQEKILAVLAGNPVRYPPSSAPGRARLRIFVFGERRRGGGRFSLFATHQFCDDDAVLLHRAHPICQGDLRLALAGDHQLQLELLVALE